MTLLTLHSRRTLRHSLPSEPPGLESPRGQNISLGLDLGLDKKTEKFEHFQAFFVVVDD